MKSTYSLLCIYLDGKKLPTKKPEIINLSKTTDYLDIDNDYTLFDYPICKRKISGIRILSANSADEINTAIKNLVNYKKVVIELDYYSVSKVACTLFLKRILQDLWSPQNRSDHRLFCTERNRIDISVKKVRANRALQKEIRDIFSVRFALL